MVWQDKQSKQKYKLLPSMWPQAFSIIFGLWLMIAPAVFPHTGSASNNAHVFGPIAITFAAVALWEATRLVRWANLPIGLWLIIAPWILAFSYWPVTINCMIIGIILAFLSTKKGVVNKKYGGGWSALFE